MSAAAIAWAKTPRSLTHLAGHNLTLAEKYVWEQANRQLCLGSEISVGPLARMCEASERFIQKALGKLARLGLLPAQPRPGKTTVYALPHTYLEAKATPERNAGVTPERNAPGDPGPYKERARHAFKQEKELEKKAFYEGKPEKPDPPPEPESHAAPSHQQPPPAKAELIEQLEQRRVDTRPHRALFSAATPAQLAQAIRRGDRDARGPGLYITILRRILGLQPRPPAIARARGSGGFERAATILQRIGLGG